MERAKGWRNGCLGVSAEVVQGFGSGSLLKQIRNTPGVVFLGSNSWAVCLSRFNDEVKHIKVVEKDNWIHITEAKKFESLLVRAPVTPAAPDPGHRGPLVLHPTTILLLMAPSLCLGRNWFFPVWVGSAGELDRVPGDSWSSVVHCPPGRTLALSFPLCGPWENKGRQKVPQIPFSAQSQHAPSCEALGSSWGS